MKCKYDVKYDFLSNELNSIASELCQNPIKYSYLKLFIQIMIDESTNNDFKCVLSWVPPHAVIFYFFFSLIINKKLVVLGLVF